MKVVLKLNVNTVNFHPVHKSYITRVQQYNLVPLSVSQVAPKIKERMMKEGTMMITYQPVNDLPNFFRLVLQNSSLTRSDMDYFVGEIERLGSDL